MRRGLILVTVGLLGTWALAGCSGDDSGSSSSKTDSGGVTVPAGGEGTPVAATAGDKSDTEQFLTVTPTSAKAGKVTFTLTNTGTKAHEMVVLKTDTPYDQLEVGTDNKVSEDTTVGEIGETAAGKTATVTLDLAAGKYVLVCNIEKHYAQGMRSAFTVG